MNTRRGFLRLTIVLSITAYIVAFLICLASIPPEILTTEELFGQKPNQQPHVPEGFVLDKPKDSFIPDQPQQESFWDKFEKKYITSPRQEEIKKYHQAQRNLIFIPLIAFVGVWSLWIVYFIAFWVVKGFRGSQR